MPPWMYNTIGKVLSYVSCSTGMQSPGLGVEGNSPKRTTHLGVLAITNRIGQRRPTQAGHCVCFSESGRLPRRPI
jgi:hypothetical protein